LRHVEVLLLSKQQGVQALLEVTGAVAVGPGQGEDDIKNPAIHTEDNNFYIYIKTFCLPA